MTLNTQYFFNKKITLYSCIGIVIALGIYIQMAAWIDVPKITGPAIPYDHLSSEETEPFIIRAGGIRPADYGGNSKMDKKYTSTVRKFDDVRDCLVSAEAKKTIPDLRFINWGKMRSEANIEVCMYRIFASLGSPEKAKLWFEAQGLKNVRINKRIASKKVNGKIIIANGGHVDDEQITVSASNHPKKSGRRYVSLKKASVISLSRYLIYAESFGVTWSNGGTSLGAGYSTATT